MPHGLPFQLVSAGPLSLDATISHTLLLAFINKSQYQLTIYAPGQWWGGEADEGDWSGGVCSLELLLLLLLKCRYSDLALASLACSSFSCASSEKPLRHMKRKQIRANSWGKSSWQAWFDL